MCALVGFQKREKIEKKFIDNEIELLVILKKKVISEMKCRKKCIHVPLYLFSNAFEEKKNNPKL